MAGADSRSAVVEAGVAHAGVIAALHAACFEDGGGWSGPSLASLIGTPGTFALIAGAADEPAGFIVCRAAAGEAEVLTVGVRPAERRRGFGGRLLDAALARLRAAGAAEVFLEVEAGNLAAAALYRSRGFCEVGRRPHYYTRPGAAAADALVLRLDLVRFSTG